ncbi:uncharacterized protein MONOS_5772 [Monocercomonoides exilis]|uniref:uncharacterized protein n=1 Tax=Monocercomonoides exilis TaxID=2049356 RepID=UPI003559E2A5|nr:hypothetical protein MONOS_5772 [Monocercomonoides exilis]|eukprot:MONOS_5772.1-p1 / transcript=MONOS_5772.1 / gene=MONOS_5772 / organism=Monocercomonoides_exilis_PA203 / gene_product=unspecified product / transcript_product=unspecified product / location=Mono_scaffold00172:100746-101990(-) / protein_length=415 / sequence_SO=supercontig / SO=protein_coding / is_pseudo=false
MAARQKHRNQLEESRCTCDTSSVILSLSSSTPSSSSRSSKTFFRDPKDESKMTAKRKKCSKDNMVLFQEDEGYYFGSKNTTANKALCPSVSQSSSSALSIHQISLLIFPQRNNKHTKVLRNSLHATLEEMKRRKKEKKNIDFLSLYSLLTPERILTLMPAGDIAPADDKWLEEEVKDADVVRGVEEGENESEKERKEYLMKAKKEIDERLRRIKEWKLREEREREAERMKNLPFNQQNAINTMSIEPNQTLQSTPQPTTSASFFSSSLSSSSPSSSSTQISFDNNQVVNALPSSPSSLSLPLSMCSLSPFPTSTPSPTHQMWHPVPSSSLPSSLSSASQRLFLLRHCAFLSQNCQPFQAASIELRKRKRYSRRWRRCRRKRQRRRQRSRWRKRMRTLRKIGKSSKTAEEGAGAG